ncbi:MAG: hypothetical protein JJU08_00390 [Rhodobacteraceae bacterium]|nr:hypothetical protein [Paracoccaceae bacterium]
MGTVVHLRQRETIAVDSNHIAAMFRHMGAAQAEMAIITAIEDLMAHLRLAEAALADGRFDQVPEHAQAAYDQAEGIGLVSLASVLVQLDAACQAKDTTAAHALWHRATRVGDMSFVDLWELPLLQM